MADRYTELSRIEENLYLEGSPIIIETGALLKDNSDESVLCHLRLKNAYSSTLLYCKIGIKEIRVDGTVNNDIVEHFYVDLKTSAGGTFGEGKIIKLTDYLTRQVEVCVIEAKYENGLIWASPFCNWLPLPQRESLKSYSADYSIVHQYAIEVGGNATYIPKIVNGTFFCTCGEISYISTCNKCGRKYDNLIEKLDKEKLKVKVNERLEKEEAEKQEWERKRLEKETIEQQKISTKRNKTKLILKSLLIASALLFICSTSIYFFSPYTLPFLCKHKIVEATCIEGSYCLRCGKEFEQPQGHKFDIDSCEYSICNECHLKISNNNHHDWLSATCIKPKTCKKCGLQEGDLARHNYSFTTNKCTVCGALNPEKR